MKLGGLEHIELGNRFQIRVATLKGKIRKDTRNLKMKLDVLEHI